MIVEHYGIKPDKVQVVHNAVYNDIEEIRNNNAPGVENPDNVKTKKG